MTTNPPELSKAEIRDVVAFVDGEMDRDEAEKFAERLSQDERLEESVAFFLESQRSLARIHMGMREDGDEPGTSVWVLMLPMAVAAGLLVGVVSFSGGYEESGDAGADLEATTASRAESGTSRYEPASPMTLEGRERFDIELDPPDAGDAYVSVWSGHHEASPIVGAVSEQAAEEPDCPVPADEAVSQGEYESTLDGPPGGILALGCELSYAVASRRTATHLGAEFECDATSSRSPVLAIREAASGPGRPDVAESLNRLGLVLQETGDYPVARRAYERALRLIEMSLGREHPEVVLEVARSLDNLAQLSRAKGDLLGARLSAERALVIREAALGARHPDVAASLTSLGFLVQEQGDLAAARVLHERALSILEDSRGPEHPDVAQSQRILDELARAEESELRARQIADRAYETRVFKP